MRFCSPGLPPRARPGPGAPPGRTGATPAPPQAGPRRSRSCPKRPKRAVAGLLLVSLAFFWCRSRLSQTFRAGFLALLRGAPARVVPWWIPLGRPSFESSGFLVSIFVLLIMIGSPGFEISSHLREGSQTAFSFFWCRSRLSQTFRSRISASPAKSPCSVVAR